VSTDSGCLGYDTITVNVQANSINYFVVPNAFTPNGDGHNDCFGIQHWAATVVNEFDVYNRWGTLVFTTKNPSDCWDGSLNGVPQPAAAYVYVIKAVTPCGPVVRTGTVMLLR
jgi:gliding motility-associated-like protein